MQKKNQQGIVLITTMCFLVVVIMITTLIAGQGKVALQSGIASMHSEEAYMAALSGIDFVRGELRKEKLFGAKAFSTYNQKVENANFPTTLFVQYDNPKKNDIIGLIGANSENDYKAKFYISFAMFPNFTHTIDSHDQPQGGLQTANFRHGSTGCRYCSVNNVTSALKIDKDVDSGIRRDIPPYTIYIVSKGVCGKAVRYAEAFLTSAGSMAVDSGTTIGGNITIKGTDFSNYTKGRKTTDENGNVMYENSNNLLTVDNVNKSDKGVLTAFSPTNGECNQRVELSANGDLADIINLTNKVEINGNLTNNRNISDQTLASNFSTNNNSKVDVDSLNSLTFDKAKDTVNSDLNNNSDKSKLDEGSYIYLLEKQNGEYIGAKWVFLPNIYNDDFSSASDLSRTSYKSKVESNIKLLDESFGGLTQLTSSSYEGISFGAVDSTSKFSSRTVVVSNNITSKGSINFAVVEKTLNEEKSTSDDNTNTNTENNGEQQEVKTTATYELLKDHTIDFRINDGASIVSNGNIDINGEVVGSGNLIAKKNIMFNAGSDLEVEKNQKVAVWAGENVTIANAKNVSNETWKYILENYEEYKNSINETIIEKITNGTTAEAIIEEINKINNGNSGNDVEVVTNVNKSKKEYSFTYDGKSYNIKKDGINKVKVSNGSETETVKDLRTGKRIGDLYVAYKHPSGHCCDFNIFVKDSDGKYYYYGTIDFRLTSSKFKDNSPGHVSGSDLNNMGGSYGRLYDLKMKKDAEKKKNETLSSEGNVELLIARQIATSKTSIKGTLYSKNGNIIIDGGHNDFNVLGALIACNGKLDISAGHVNLTYDPNYVPFFSNIGIKTNVNFISSFIGGK